MKAWTFTYKTSKAPAGWRLGILAMLLMLVGMTWYSFNNFRHAQQSANHVQQALLLLERIKLSMALSGEPSAKAIGTRLGNENAANTASAEDISQFISSLPTDSWWQAAYLEKLRQAAAPKAPAFPFNQSFAGVAPYGADAALSPALMLFFVDAENAALDELARLQETGRQAVRVIRLSGGFLAVLIVLCAAAVLTPFIQAGRRRDGTPDERACLAEQRIAELMQTNAELTRQLNEHRHATESLRHMQYMLTSAERIGHVGSWEHHLASGNDRWSDAFFRMCGLEPGSVAPSLQAFLKMVHPEDGDAVINAIERAVEEDKEYKVSMRIVRPDGSLCHMVSQAEIIRGHDGRPEYLVGSAIDITEHKEAEETLRRLAVHQVRIREQERKRIAREIHDEMGQNLLALRIDVEMLRARTFGRHPLLHEKLESLLVNIDGIIKSVRLIINNLRPVVLDLGLYAAIQWQVSEFQRRSGITCVLTANAAELDLALSDDQTTTLFRILQESLTNVARHAKAGNVHISLERVGDRLFMNIVDDGVGMRPAGRSKSNSFGLMGIRERISAIGGELRIDSRPGQGMALLLSIPVEAAQAKTHGRHPAGQKKEAP